MKGKNYFNEAWAVFDRLLLVAVFVLLGMVWFSMSRTDAEMSRCKAGDAARGNGMFRRPASASKTVNGFRVSAGHTRMNTIARSMVASGWEQLPSSPAMDMREDGKMYEILFSLPAGVAQESVQVTASGNVLTLAMKDSDTGKTYMQRVRIPCGVERADNIQSAISNDVLRVRILHPGG